MPICLHVDGRGHVSRKQDMKAYMSSSVTLSISSAHFCTAVGPHHLPEFWAVVLASLPCRERLSLTFIRVALSVLSQHVATIPPRIQVSSQCSRSSRLSIILSQGGKRCRKPYWRGHIEQAWRSCGLQVCAQEHQPGLMAAIMSAPGSPVYWQISLA